MAKKETGRPTKKDPEVVTKLISAFAMGFTIKEACAYSGIARETFYRWINDDLEFNDKIQQAKARLNIKAKEVLVDAIQNGDVNSAKWWLTKYDKPDDINGNLSFQSKLLRSIVVTKERLIAYRYRNMLFRERESLIGDGKESKKLEPQLERIDKLIRLSDTELSDYAEMEISSLNKDRAGVREELLNRHDFRALVKDEINILEKYDY